jgi:hypothetical protein
VAQATDSYRRPAPAKLRGAPTPAPRPEVRGAVRDLLTKSPAFSRLHPDVQRQIAHDTAQVADYLAAPEGFPGNRLASARSLAGGLAGQDGEDASGKEQWGRDKQAVDDIGQRGFKAEAAREGAEVAGLLLTKVDFPTFCASLIQGVFHAIVQSSIEQMEAYGKMVASVAKSLNQFRDENVSDNQGRDHLVEKFPDMFEIGTDGFDGQQSPRVKLREGVDEDAALKKVNRDLPMEGGALGSLDLEDQDTEDKLVQAARTQLATSRQQLLATMVLMGINRIVVTDGKISAKIMYDFQARDNRKFQRSASAFDVARDRSGRVQRTSEVEGETESKQEFGAYKKTGGDEDRGASNFYAKGSYKYKEQPIVTAMSTAAEASESALSTRAQLAGVVDINFKSDYFPLEKMADSFQVAQIQNASKPGTGTKPAAGAAPPASAVSPGTGTGAAPPK